MTNPFSSGKDLFFGLYQKALMEMQVATTIDSMVRAEARKDAYKIAYEYLRDSEKSWIEPVENTNQEITEGKT